MGKPASQLLVIKGLKISENPQKSPDSRPKKQRFSRQRAPVVVQFAAEKPGVEVKPGEAPERRLEIGVGFFAALESCSQLIE